MRIPVVVAAVDRMVGAAETCRVPSENPNGLRDRGASTVPLRSE